MAGVWQLLDRRQPPLSNFIKGKAFREHTTLYKDFVMGKTLGREYILLGSQILNFALYFPTLKMPNQLGSCHSLRREGDSQN